MERLTWGQGCNFCRACRRRNATRACKVGQKGEGTAGLGERVVDPQLAGPTVQKESLTCLSNARRFCSSESLSWPQCTWSRSDVRTPKSRPSPCPQSLAHVPALTRITHTTAPLFFSTSGMMSTASERVSVPGGPQGQPRAEELSSWGACLYYVLMCHDPPSQPSIHLPIHPLSICPPPCLLVPENTPQSQCPPVPHASILLPPTCLCIHHSPTCCCLSHCL